MAEVTAVVLNSVRLRDDSHPLGEPVDFDLKGLGRRLPRIDAPEGWIKKTERRQGKGWVGFFHVWVADANGRRIRQKKEKTLGLASIPKHEAQLNSPSTSKNTGRIRKQGDAIATFAHLPGEWSAIRNGLPEHVKPRAMP